MNDILGLFRKVIIQIATPDNTGGTGFYLKGPHLIVTNEHVVRGNRHVVIDGELIPKQLATILFTDPVHDLAFIDPPEMEDLPEVELRVGNAVKPDDTVWAIGHPFGLKYNTTKGIVSGIESKNEQINYIRHDAALNPGNSGGPLLDEEGRVVGVNTFVIRDGDNLGFSLPAELLQKSLDDYSAGSRVSGTRCSGCGTLVWESTVQDGYCPNCGNRVELPMDIEEFEPLGVSKTVEEMIVESGYDVRLSRSGPNNWQIKHGSAKINISYYEKTGLITGDAYLCTLPQENIQPLYEYLLRQNYELENLTFSIRGQDIILSLLIYDRYLNVSTGLTLFQHLFDKADYYDNILVDEFGANWKYQES